jgi:DNA-binding NtrC family response regulator
MTGAITEKLTRMAKDQGRPFRVLIVDDEEWVRDVFRDFCQLSEACDVELAESGTVAIEKAKQTRYDVITLDLIMPEVSGLEVLVAIKEASPGSKVMIITGNATEKLVHQAGVMGASRVMYKPVAMQSFIEELTTTLETQNQSRS